MRGKHNEPAEKAESAECYNNKGDEGHLGIINEGKVKWGRDTNYAMVKLF